VEQLVTSNLWHENTPKNFWQCVPDLAEEVWLQAYQNALPSLGLPVRARDINAVMSLTLGEQQFGSEHWQLNPLKQAYYLIKPLLPRPAINILKKLNTYSVNNREAPQLTWPIEQRLVLFYWNVMKELMDVMEVSSLSFHHFWPEGRQVALVLTHDIETEAGQNYVRAIADLEEQLGFRSSFNFVPERYPLDYTLIDELRSRGFEIGVHGLKHDGKLFRSAEEFNKRAKRINSYLQTFGAVGFRSPLTHRNPDWMQSLDIKYDSSFFDTDPYEPLPGGCMSIWPYRLGHFIELPYTLVQDSTLRTVLGKTNSQLWLDKLDFIEQYYGMALINTHPDYLRDPELLNMYESFLQDVNCRDNYWLALPQEVAEWWRKRTEIASGKETADICLGKILLENRELKINSN
jgi:hypothetical protein